MQLKSVVLFTLTSTCVGVLGENVEKRQAPPSDIAGLASYLSQIGILAGTIFPSDYNYLDAATSLVGGKTPAAFSTFIAQLSGTDADIARSAFSAVQSLSTVLTTPSAVSATPTSINVASSSITDVPEAVSELQEIGQYYPNIFTSGFDYTAAVTSLVGGRVPPAISSLIDALPPGLQSSAREVFSVFNTASPSTTARNTASTGAVATTRQASATASGPATTSPTTLSTQTRGTQSYGQQSGTAAPVDNDGDNQQGGLSTGAKIGIGVGAPAAAILLGLLAFFITREIRRNKKIDNQPGGATGAGMHQTGAAPMYGNQANQGYGQQQSTWQKPQEGYHQGPAEMEAPAAQYPPQYPAQGQVQPPQQPGAYNRTPTGMAEMAA